MKEYDKPIIEDESISMIDIICVSVNDSTSDGDKKDWSDIVNGK